MVEIRQSNPKAFEELNLKLKALEGTETRVGWGESAKYEDGTSVAYVAAIQELGSGPIPPRPFMRPAAIKNEAAWQEVAAIGAERVIDGKMNAHDAMELLGQRAQDDVLDAIVAVNAPPLSMITLVARKMRRQGKKVTGGTIGWIAKMLKMGHKFDVSGVSTKPLNDTGHMIATLTHVTDSVVK